jgi:hypothetical protein
LHALRASVIRSDQTDSPTPRAFVVQFVERAQQPLLTLEDCRFVRARVAFR